MPITRGTRVSGVGGSLGGNYGGAGFTDRPPKRGVNPDAAYDKDDPFAFLEDFLNYETPQEEISRQLNVLKQILSAQQTKQNTGLAQRTAARTGGRLGSTERGYSDIGGQIATAGQMGASQILSDASDREIKMKLAGLSAYIQKYGIDKNAQLALQQLQAQKDAASGQMYGDILGTIFKAGIGLL